MSDPVTDDVVEVFDLLIEEIGGLVDRPVPEALLIDIFAAASSISPSAGPDLGPVVVGGQALSAWTNWWEASDHFPEDLEAYLPVTSKDVDFLGNYEDARQLSEKLKAKDIARPSLDDVNTPNTAVITVSPESGIDETYVIDFLRVIAGVNDNGALYAMAVKIELPGRDGPIQMRVMHPLHLFLARIGSIVILKQFNLHKVKQLAVATILLRSWIASLLRDASSGLYIPESTAELNKEAVRLAKAFITHAALPKNDVLLSELGIDLLTEADKLAGLPGWDPRFVQPGIIDAIDKLRERRDSRIRESARRLAGKGA